MVESRSTVMPALRYRNAPAAVDWLCQVFGFERHACIKAPTEPLLTRSSSSAAE